MAFVDNNDIGCAVKEIFNEVNKIYGPIVGLLNDEINSEFKDNVRSIIGKYTGIRTEDGEERLYEVTQLEGEPYVYDA